MQVGTAPHSNHQQAGYAQPKKRPIYASRRGQSNSAYCPSTTVNPMPSVRFNLELTDELACEGEEHKVRTNAFNAELQEKADIIAMLCALELVSQDELDTLVGQASLSKKEATLITVLTDCHIKANNRLIEYVADIKEELVREGFQSELVEKAIKKSEMDMAFFPFDQKYLAYTEMGMMQPIVYCCNRMNDDALAAQVLLAELAHITGNGMIDDAMMFGYCYGEMPTMPDLDALTKLCASAPDFSNDTAVVVSWLADAARVLGGLDKSEQDMIDELLCYRTDEHIQIDKLTHITPDKAAELEEYGFLSQLEYVLNDILAFNIVYADCKRIRSASFSDSIRPDSPHYDFLNRLHQSIESLKSIKTEGMQVVNDVYGSSYFFIPCENNPRWSHAYEVLEEIERSNMEAEETCSMHILNDPSEGAVTIKRHLKGAALASLLDHYLCELPPTKR